MSTKSRLPFDRAGGTIVMPRRLLASPAFLRLSARAKALLFLLHRHWTPKGPVAFGVRQAQTEIPCSRRMAMEAFGELQKAGFIVKVDESLFSSRTQSRTRTWRLTWMPDWNHRAPSNDWERPS